MAFANSLRAQHEDYDNSDTSDVRTTVEQSSPPQLSEVAEAITAIEDPLLRLEYSIRAESLLYRIDESESYNEQAIVCDGLGIENTDSGERQPVSGADLYSAVRQLIDEISKTTIIPVEDVVERVLTIEEAAKHWNVSPRTVQRWCERGLVARTFTFGERKRTGFLQSSLHLFSAAHPDIVRYGSTFSRITDEERERILQRADAMLNDRTPIGVVITTIAEDTQRSMEEIRSLLKQANVSAGRAPRQLNEKEQRMERAQHVRALPLDFMPAAEFEEENADKQILAPTPASSNGKRLPRKPSGLPAYIASLYDVPLLSAEQETHLFRMYNYLKCKASKLRDELDPANPKAKQMDTIEALYEKATETRIHLIRANMRLVVAVAKKYIDSTGDLFDKISDGNLALMRAVEKFDYTRGFKFSTYVTWAIKKNNISAYNSEIKQTDRFRTGQAELIDAQIDTGSNAQVKLQAHSHLKDTTSQMLLRLKSREEYVVTSRFGIGENNDPRTRKEIGVELGVSKERVRQIEKKSLRKLRDVVDTLCPEHDFNSPQEGDDTHEHTVKPSRPGAASDVGAGAHEISETHEGRSIQRTLLTLAEGYDLLGEDADCLSQLVPLFDLNGKQYCTLEDLELYLVQRAKNTLSIPNDDLQQSGRVSLNGDPEHRTLITARATKRILKASYRAASTALTRFGLKSERSRKMRFYYSADEVESINRKY